VSKRALAIFLLLVGMAAGQTKPSRAPTPKPETPHLRFVKEYVRELIADESLKINGEKEFGEAKTDNERIADRNTASWCVLRLLPKRAVGYCRNHNVSQHCDQGTWAGNASGTNGFGLSKIS
jgi:hypothetical protein